MFIVTNREVHDDGKRTGVERFGKKLNPEGANELRMAEVGRRNRRWKITILPNEMTPEMMDEVGLRADELEDLYSSRYVARRIFGRVNPTRARELGVKNVATKGRNLLFFVHGFNNNMEDVLGRARALERLYGVEVVAFSWPANGGGARGVASYKSDKRDAKASIGALDRTLERLLRRLAEFNAAHRRDIRARGAADFPGDAERRERFVSRAYTESCPFTINALFHSMGNYLYKHLLKSGSSEGTDLLFDNVVLASADTNNENHADWVDRVRLRRRLYITINEDDSALAAARAKSGDEQKARLGHYPYDLHSRQGVYVQFTGETAVGTAHAYFEGEAPTGNTKIKKFFKGALNGARVESMLDYDAGTNMYLFR